MVGIYRFETDYGRCGTLSGIFTASEEDIQRIHSNTIYFGECLGKHSEVCFDPGELLDCVSLITDDPEVIAMFQKNAMWTGYDLTDYLEDE